MADVVMPRLSDSMEEGTVLSWLKADGDEVAAGEELAEIETDKATQTYEAEAAGVLRIVAAEGTTVPVGATIARLEAPAAAPAPDRANGDGAAAPPPPDGAGASAGAPAGAAAAGSEAPAPGAGGADGPGAKAPAPGAAGADAAGAEAPATAAPPSPAAGGEVRASPVARRIARERGIDLRTVRGSGPGGRVVRADVAPEEAPPAVPPQRPPAPDAAPAGGPPAPAAVPGGRGGTAKGEVTEQELTRTQQVIARRMAESKATIPDFSITTEVDMDRAVDLRAQLKTLGGPVPSYNDMVVRACALALREHPKANGSYRDGRFAFHGRVNVGVAVAADGALVVPTVFDADRKPLGQIAEETRALAERVRAGAVTAAELGGGTFTVSNMGMHGVTEFQAVINPPQAAILAVGQLRQAPVVRDGAVVVGHVLKTTLVCDHRILYGADAAAFLGRVRELLEAPAALLA